MGPKTAKVRKMQASEVNIDKDDAKRKRWTETEKTKIAEYILEAHKEGKYDRKDIKNFIEKMRAQLGFACTYKQIRNCYEKLEIKYKFVNEWLDKTGSGLQETDPGSIEAFLKKHCPQFKILEEVWGTRNDINPPIVYDSGFMVNKGGNQLENVPVDFAEDGTHADFEILSPEENVIQIDLIGEGEPENVPEKETSRRQTPPSVLSESAASFRRTLNKPGGSKRKNIATSLDDLDFFMNKKVEVEEKRLNQEKEHRDMQLSIEESKLQIQRDQLGIQKSQFEETERNRLMIKVMEMQERRDLELLKMGKEPDLSYGQRLMQVCGIFHAIPSASAPGSSSEAASGSGASKSCDMSSIVHESESNRRL